MFGEFLFSIPGSAFNGCPDSSSTVACPSRVPEFIRFLECSAEDL